MGAALLDSGLTSVPELRTHPLIRAKDAVSQQQNVQAMLWAMLQQNTVDDALIIDEVNRANVSSGFGELITLLEEDNRRGAASAHTHCRPHQD